MKESFEIGLDWFHAAHVGVNNNILALQKRERDNELFDVSPAVPVNVI